MSSGSNPLNGFSFSLGIKNQPKKEKLNTNIFGIQEDDDANKKIFITEVVNNKIKEEVKKEELVIPLKKPSWIAKAKERLEKEKQEKQEQQEQQEKQEKQEKQNKANDMNEQKEEQKTEKAELTDKDRARISILKEVCGIGEEESHPDLVIPLHKSNETTSSDKEGKKGTLISRNRLPGAENMSKDEYFHRMVDALPEERDPHNASYQQIKIEDFGKAVLRGMGWDGKNNVDSSVYEIKPRPERLGLGAIPLVIDKKTHISAVKKSATDRSISKSYNGIINEWGEKNEMRLGVQVGIITGPYKGLQGGIVETPKSSSPTIKVLLDGKAKVMEIQKTSVIMLNDLVSVKSFNDKYGNKMKSDSTTNTHAPNSSSHNRERSRSRERSYERDERSHRSHSHNHHHHHTNSHSGHHNSHHHHH